MYLYLSSDELKKNQDRWSRLGTGGIIFGTAPLVSGPGVSFSGPLLSMQATRDPVPIMAGPDISRSP